jgi:hypothetical protein
MLGLLLRETIAATGNFSLTFGTMSKMLLFRSLHRLDTRTQRTFTNKCALIVGAGDCTGAAIARAFAAEGYVACCVRRDGEKALALAASIQKLGHAAEGFGVDCRDESNVQSLVENIETKIGPIDVAVFNVGANVRFPITGLPKSLQDHRFPNILQTQHRGSIERCGKWHVSLDSSSAEKSLLA